jgi:hypothetical protein
MIFKPIKAFFILIALLYNLQAKAQEYFNILYSHSLSAGFSNPFAAGSIIELKDGYVFTGAMYNPEGTGTRTLTKISLSGEPLWHKTVSTYPQISTNGKLIKLNTGFIMAGSVNEKGLPYSHDDEDLWLVRYNDVGDTLWTRKYGGAGAEICNDFKRTQDGGYVITGSTRSFGAGSADFYLVKTDSLGNLQWQKTYGGAKVDVAFSVVQTSDGGYILSGYSNSYSSSYDLLVIKTDEAGGEQWKKNYGTNADDYAGRIIQLREGNYLVPSATPNSLGNPIGKLYKLNLEGEIIWLKNFNYSNLTAFMGAPIENEDKTIIFHGAIDSPIRGWLVKLTSEGDTLWTKSYAKREDRSNYIYDLKATSDGGYIFCGSANDSIQKAWIVKTDCFGCDGDLCHYPDSVCEDFTSVPAVAGTAVFNFKIAPNPASQYVNVLISELANEGMVVIYDICGKKVKEENISGRSSIQIDLSDVSAGIYYCALVKGNVIVGREKLVVVR